MAWKILDTENAGKPVMVFMCIIFVSTLAAIGAALSDVRLMIGALIVPYIILFAVHVLKSPHLALLLVVVFYMLDIQLNLYGLTPNIFLIAICGLSILVNGIDFKIVADKLFLFFLSSYVILIVISYTITNNELNLYNVYINNIIILLLMFLFDSRKKIEDLYKVIIFCSLFLVLTGFFQLLSEGFPDYGMTGYWSNHVRYGLHIGWGIPLSFYFYRVYQKNLYKYVLIVLLFGVFLAFSRGVLLALSGAALLGAIIYNWPVATLRRRFQFLGGGIFLGLVFIVLMLNPQFLNAKYDFEEINQFSSGRIILYQAALGIFKENPIFGVGWEKYRKEWSDYADIRRPRYGSFMGEKNYNTHSSYLKIIAELGLFGFVIFFMFNYFLVRSTYRESISSIGLPLLIILLTYYIHGFVDNNSYGNDRIFYITSGLLFSIKHITKEFEL